MGDTQTMDFSMNIGWPDTGACVSDRGRCYMLVKVGGEGSFSWKCLSAVPGAWGGYVGVVCVVCAFVLWMNEWMNE